jgi:hypothetical protein
MSWQNDNPFADNSVNTGSSYNPPSIPSTPAPAETPAWADTSTTMGASNFGQESQQGLLASSGSAWDNDDLLAIPEPVKQPQPVLQQQPPLQQLPSGPMSSLERPSQQFQSQPQQDVTMALTDKPSDALPKLILTMRLYNMGLSIFMSFAGFMSLLGDDLPSGVLALYLMVFSTLLCCFETHLKAVSQFISDNFGFLYHAKGRAAFLIFVSLLCFSQGLLGKICGVAMLFNAVFTFYVIFKYPEYEEIHRKYGTEDAGSVAARHGIQYAQNNPAQVQRAATAGASWAAQNPEAAANAYGQQQQQQVPQKQDPQFSFV